jgi:hypothetical protein
MAICRWASGAYYPQRPDSKQVAGKLYNLASGCSVELLQAQAQTLFGVHLDQKRSGDIEDECYLKVVVAQVAIADCNLLR